MSISQLDIFNFRNIQEANLRLNNNSLFVGLNGSGKTSILEAIYLLSCGKSFRSNQIETVINHASDHLIVRGISDENSVGLQRWRNGKVAIRLNNNDLKKVSELSKLIPAHVIEPNSIAVIESSPSERRRFLDFAMFHVEHDYLVLHKKFSIALKQRNSLLRSLKLGASYKELDYWDSALVNTAWQLHECRERLFREVLSPALTETISRLLPEQGITAVYSSGCKNAASCGEFAELIRASREVDIRYKSSQIGPHRADIVLKTKGKLAKDYLSRGQKKLLTYGVRLAPALMLKKANLPVGVVLIDDMPSELDETSTLKICQLLNDIQGQSILTAVDSTNTQTEIIIDSMKPAMFHVEHGTIEQR